MTCTAFKYELCTDFKSIVKVISLVHAENCSKLFASPCIVMRSVVSFSYENLGFRRHIDTCHFSQLNCSLTYGCRLNAVSFFIEEYCGNLVSFSLVKEVAASVLH